MELCLGQKHPKWAVQVLLEVIDCLSVPSVQSKAFLDGIDYQKY